jgi:hypothetical protein
VLNINVKRSYDALVTRLNQLRGRDTFDDVEACGDNLLDRY